VDLTGVGGRVAGLTPLRWQTRMDYKAPIEPKDVDAIVDYFISIRGAN